MMRFHVAFLLPARQSAAQGMHLSENDGIACWLSSEGPLVARKKLGSPAPAIGLGDDAEDYYAGSSKA
jgi:hypothetical protein